jgi:hypothetical protein
MAKRVMKQKFGKLKTAHTRNFWFLEDLSLGFFLQATTHNGGWFKYGSLMIAVVL